MEKDYEVIEEIKEDFPVYVYEESIPDILVINEIQEEIDNCNKSIEYYNKKKK